MPSSVSREGDAPLVKRQKLNDTSTPPVRQSRIFTPFRTVGLISSTQVPFTSVPLGKTTFQITTSIGRSLQTYDLKRGLNLVFLTRPQTPREITAVTAWKDRVFAAWGSAQDESRGLWVFKRGKKIAEFELPSDLTQSIQKITIFGTWIVACCSTRIEVWRSATYEHYTTLYPTAAARGGNELTALCTMPTYLNKIFAGRKDGRLEIWNVSSGKLIYTILPPAADCGGITALQPTPALSLMAIAYSNGPIVIHNILTDKSIIHLTADTAVTSISFRTDGQGAGEDGQKDGVMATAGPENGDVTIWDLNNGGRVMGILRGAHNPPSAAARAGGGVNKVEFLAGQPVMVTSGLDNSLKSWIFDETPFSPVPRILHSRSGHAGPVTQLKFLPTDSEGADFTGKWLLSAGKDRSLWGWSLRRDNQSTELSQGSIQKKARKLGIVGNVADGTSTTLEDLKAPEIISIAISMNRDGGIGAHGGSGIWNKGAKGRMKATDATASGNTGWESVVTGHKNDKYARTWFWGRKRAGRWAFETGDGANVSSVAISPCGTFAVVGSAAGGIDMFNLQSGMHRQRFPSRLTPQQATKLKMKQAEAAQRGITSLDKFEPGMGKHRKAVTGLIVDSLNNQVVSCSLDGMIKFWSFATGNLVHEIDWAPMNSIMGMNYHASSDLIAVVSDDHSIRVVDIETHKTIRELWGCQGRINDFAFSHDGRWIIAAAADRTVRVWDLPTGHLIDAMRLATPCVALAFSGTGEYLATACEGKAGVDVWNNKALFQHVPTRHIGEADIAEIDAPTASGEGGHGLLEGAFEDEEDAGDDSLPVLGLEQLSADMMTLSLVPKSRWQTLVHLDLIKARNKPTEAPKVPEKAPFFLPSLDSSKAIAGAGAESNDQGDQSRIMRMDRGASEGAFTLTLRQGAETGDYESFITHLKTLSPSAADLEIRSLSPLSSELSHFVRALTSRLDLKRDYELVQAWMTVFLRLHADLIVSDGDLRRDLAEWKEMMAQEGERLGRLVGFCAGVSGFLRNPRV